MPPSSPAASAAACSRSCAGAETAHAIDPRRELLLGLWQTGLARVHGRSCVAHALRAAPLAGPVWLAAVGKAAIAMALGAHDALGAAIERTLIITRDEAGLAELSRQSVAPEIWFGAHPVPDERSLAAGRRLLSWVHELPEGVQPLFLVSGGASSLAEVLEEGTTLRTLEDLTTHALAGGMPIGELNAQRTALSRIKGGRLASHLKGRPARALFISDVPHDDTRVIGSGLMGPAASGADRVTREVVASVDQACAAIAAEATRLGLSVHAPPARFAGDALRLAARFAHELSMASVQLCVWGGESTVQLPVNPGRGGRNQHLALAAARLIAGHDELLLLIAGTDGTDGNTEDAGALVDADSCARLALAQLDADRCLQQADAARALAASGDLLHTGVTGSNVGDLVIGLKLSAAAARALLAQHHGGSDARML